MLKSSHTLSQSLVVVPQKLLVLRLSNHSEEVWQQTAMIHLI